MILAFDLKMRRMRGWVTYERPQSRRWGTWPGNMVVLMDMDKKEVF